MTDLGSGDLSPEALAAVLPDRPVRVYPALLSTEADALAWARAGAPHGALVAADYQAAARGRQGEPWPVRAGEDAGCSVVVRPRLAAQREGWLHVVAGAALADVLGPTASIEWPDMVRAGERSPGMAVHVELGAGDVVAWAVLSFLLRGVAGDRARRVADLVAALEARLAQQPEAVLADYRRRCLTPGRQVHVRLVPLGPGSPEIAGRAVTVDDHGALLVATDRGRAVAVRPGDVGELLGGDA